MTQNEHEQELIQRLYKRFNCVLLSKKEVSSSIGKSVATLDRWRAQGIGPSYIKDDSSNNSSVSYSIYSIASWIMTQKTNKTL